MITVQGTCFVTFTHNILGDDTVPLIAHALTASMISLSIKRAERIVNL